MAPAMIATPSVMEWDSGVITPAQPPSRAMWIRCLQELGLTFRVALVGFDDLPWADLVQPGITVMAQDPTAMGRRAAQIVFDRLGGDDAPFRTEIIPTRLIERGSGEIRRLG